MINENMIALKESCKTPEEAVIRAGELLLKNGNVTQNYIDAMVKSYKVNGAYIVIAPRFAMPHARPEEGVLKAGFSILTLKEGVEFGSAENDPVDLIIGLAANNSNEHVEVIQKITEIFSDNEKRETIFNAENKEEIMIDNKKIEQVEDLLNNMEGKPMPKQRVKVDKKDKGIIERTENSKIVLTEDNKMVLND